MPEQQECENGRPVECVRLLTELSVEQKHSKEDRADMWREIRILRTENNADHADIKEAITGLRVFDGRMIGAAAAAGGLVSLVVSIAAIVVHALVK